MSRKRKYEYLLEKSVLAAIAAIESYNKSMFPYRQEAFAILMTNAWELLLKAKWIYDHGNNMRSIFVKQKNGRYKRNRSGNILSYDITYLLNQMKNTGNIPPNVYTNLMALIEIRDNAVHLYISPKLREQIHYIALATSSNFYLLSKKWFDSPIIKRMETMIIQPLFFIPTGPTTFTGNNSEERLYRFLQRLSETQEEDSEGFLVTAKVQLKFVRTKSSDSALPVRIASNNPNALPIELTEEQWRAKYPWEYRQLVEKLRNRYENFKENSDFHKLRKQIEPQLEQCNPSACYNKYCRIRFLNPTRPNKSPTKKFYSISIIDYFDRYYTRKKTGEKNG